MRTRPFPPLSSLGWPAWSGTLAAAAALCAIAAWWALQLLAPSAPIAPAGSASGNQALSELRLAATIFGTPAGAQGPLTASSASIEVLGVLSAEHRGSAILAVDGQPGKAFAVGEAITPTQKLLAVNGDTILIGEDGRQIELAAPARPTLSLLTDGPERSSALDPGFTAPANASPRIARPLGASDAGSLPAPRSAFVPSSGSTRTPAIRPMNSQRLPAISPASQPPKADPGISVAPSGGSVAMPGIRRPDARTQ